MTTMTATVISVQNGSLLVFDLRSRQRVRVITRNARCFRPGNFVCIRYNGVMTLSIPPQIRATRISRIPPVGPWRNWCR